ncbi:MAG: sodium ion-translocating decarboxylase subunit beta, partial [Clostridia bacterium]|nr:sodium ion-translocating decarboxylase subunit beta [Clostridia bacterium]
MEFLIDAFRHIEPQHVVMWAIGGLLIYLAIAHKIEPSLLLPMGFGAILVNIPLNNVLTEITCNVCGGVLELEGACTHVYDGVACLGEGVKTVGIIEWLFEEFIEVSEAMPILLFI